MRWQGSQGACCHSQQAMSCGYLKFGLLPLRPPQLSASVFPSSLSRAPFCPPHSFSLFSGLLRPACPSMSGHCLGWPCSWGLPVWPNEAWLDMARQLAHKSLGVRRQPTPSFYICLLCTSLFPPGCPHPSPPSFYLHPCLQLQFC